VKKGVVTRDTRILVSWKKKYGKERKWVRWIFGDM